MYVLLEVSAAAVGACAKGYSSRFVICGLPRNVPARVYNMKGGSVSYFRIPKST